ncbi:MULTISPECIES: fluoride efflux transporter CrcB [Halococcus]|uniref:Fluoride-specific ion channel FluC n=1 Tax=Halococcus salifodinae DSM 8989 TaxID=1227456 RepID=M0N689_9EURY|nr:MULTISPECIES: fluoride efflux transporter CrcB [Halococcus]EMA52634.1 integral membrane protein/crcB-like protein [Halococcus salifodinae DSM 8989]
MIPLDPAYLVGTGGALGALCRTYVSQRVDSETYPFGTLAVNVLGSFVLGLVTFAGASEEILLFLGTGACGSFTTFSSFSFETVRLVEQGESAAAAANGAVNLAGSLAAIGVAWLAVRVVLG